MEAPKSTLSYDNFGREFPISAEEILGQKLFCKTRLPRKIILLRKISQENHVRRMKLAHQMSFMKAADVYSKISRLSLKSSEKNMDLGVRTPFTKTPKEVKSNCANQSTPNSKTGHYNADSSDVTCDALDKVNESNEQRINQSTTEAFNASEQVAENLKNSNVNSLQHNCLKESKLDEKGFLSKSSAKNPNFRDRRKVPKPNFNSDIKKKDCNNEKHKKEIVIPKSKSRTGSIQKTTSNQVSTSNEQKNAGLIRQRNIEASKIPVLVHRKCSDKSVNEPPVNENQNGKSNLMIKSPLKKKDKMYLVVPTDAGIIKQHETGASKIPVLAHGKSLDMSGKESLKNEKRNGKSNRMLKSPHKKKEKMEFVVPLGDWIPEISDGGIVTQSDILKKDKSLSDEELCGNKSYSDYKIAEEMHSSEDDLLRENEIKNTRTSSGRESKVRSYLPKERGDYGDFKNEYYDLGSAEDQQVSVECEFEEDIFFSNISSASGSSSNSSFSAGSSYKQMLRSAAKSELHEKMREPLKRKKERIQ